MLIRGQMKHEMLFTIRTPLLPHSPLTDPKYGIARTKPFSLLCTIAMRALCVPTGIAQVEACFSRLRDICTPKRSGLSSEAVVDELLVSYNFGGQGKVELRSLFHEDRKLDLMEED